MNPPCRPCDQQKISISRAEFKALNVAAQIGRNAQAKLADALLKIATLQRELAQARHTIAAQEQKAAASQAGAQGHGTDGRTAQ